VKAQHLRAPHAPGRKALPAGTNVGRCGLTLEITLMSLYTVRYQLGGVEHTDSVDAENAAAAARIVEERYIDEAERFELIEVHLVVEGDETLTQEGKPA
jgi:hypothetical protein